jgi:hypothetical protein
MANGTTYFVWKRNDGAVDASCSMPRDYPTKSGEVKFELLGKFDAWTAQVVDLIESERAKTGYYTKK